MTYYSLANMGDALFVQYNVARGTGVLNFEHIVFWTVPEFMTLLSLSLRPAQRPLG